MMHDCGLVTDHFGPKNESLFPFGGTRNNENSDQTALLPALPTLSAVEGNIEFERPINILCTASSEPLVEPR